MAVEEPNNNSTEQEEEEEEEEEYANEFEENQEEEEVIEIEMDREKKIRVHDVIVTGNKKTKDSVIRAEALDAAFRAASSVQELIRAAAVANARFQRLDVFDSVNIRIESGPLDLPGTVNVVIEVVETDSPLTGDIGVFSKPEGTVWFKNAIHQRSENKIHHPLITESLMAPNLHPIYCHKDIATRVIAEELRPDETIILKVMAKNPIFVTSDSLAN